MLFAHIFYERGHHSQVIICFNDLVQYWLQFVSLDWLLKVSEVTAEWGRENSVRYSKVEQDTVNAAYPSITLLSWSSPSGVKKMLYSCVVICCWPISSRQLVTWATSFGSATVGSTRANDLITFCHDYPNKKIFYINNEQN